MATQRDPNRPELSPRKVAERLKDEGKQKLAQGKSSAADQVDSVAQALRRAGDELYGNQPMLAEYANRLATGIGRFGTRLREGSIEELASDVQAAARRNPALFIAGGFALGIVLARIVRASTATDEPAPLGTTYEELDSDLITGDDVSGAQPGGASTRSSS